MIDSLKIINDTRTMSGRDSGRYWRDKFELKGKDKDGELYCIELPEQVTSVHSSFFLGLIAVSVKTLGEKSFRDKYTFKNIERHIKSLELAITEAQLSGTVLD